MERGIITCQRSESKPGVETVITNIWHRFSLFLHIFRLNQQIYVEFLFELMIR